MSSAFTNFWEFRIWCRLMPVSASNLWSMRSPLWPVDWTRYFSRFDTVFFDLTPYRVTTYDFSLFLRLVAENRAKSRSCVTAFFGDGCHYRHCSHAIHLILVGFICCMVVLVFCCANPAGLHSYHHPSPIFESPVNTHLSLKSM